MKRQGVVALAVGLALFLGARGGDPPGPGDREKMQGTWKASSATIHGEPAPKDELDRLVVTFRDDRLIMPVEGELKVVARYRLDPGRRPHAIDLDVRQGPEQGKTALGIYEVDGDALKLCVARPGTERPAEFVSKAGSAVMLVEFRRQK
jgi:uncharacterized protein (TIGR03067 family)